MNVLDGEQVPLTWSIDSLGSLVESVRASARVSPDESYELWSVPSFSDGTPELVTGASIGSGKLELRPDDVLISKINPRINRVWLVSEPKGSLTQIGSTEWLVARIRSGVPLLPSFLAFYMSSPSVREAIKSMTQGVTGSHTRAKANQILTIPVPRPSPPEQARIVEILEEQLSRLDAAVKSVQTVREKAAQFRRSLLHAAFTGALTHPDPGRMSIENLPNSWSKSTMGEVGQYLNGFAFNSKTWGTTGRPIIRIQNLTGSGDSFNFFDGDIDDRYVVRKGDLLFSWAATLGVYVWMGPEAVLNQHIFKVKSRIDSSFHRYLIEHNIALMMTQTHGTGMVHLTKKKFDAIPVAIPPKKEQERIVEILEEQLSRLDATLAVADEVESKANALRRSLLHAAFTGELTCSWREANV